jgi:hypothetical protein
MAACLLALTGVVLAQPAGPFERALLSFLETFPDWLRPVWAFLIALLALWTAIMLVAPLVSQRARITLEAVLAVVLAIVIGLVAARIATGTWVGSEAASGLKDTQHFPAVRLAMAAAVIAVVNGHVSRPVGSTGRWLLTLGAVRWPRS